MLLSPAAVPSCCRFLVGEERLTLELAGTAPDSSYRFIPVVAQKAADPSCCRSLVGDGWLTLQLADAASGSFYRFIPVAVERLSWHFCLSSVLLRMPTDVFSFGISGMHFLLFLLYSCC